MTVPEHTVLTALHMTVCCSLCSNYRLCKGGYVFGSLGLFLCLSVSNVTHKVMNKLQLNCVEWLGVVQ